MKKYLKYLCIAIFLFIGFGINNVEAKKDSYFACNYESDDKENAFTLSIGYVSGVDSLFYGGHGYFAEGVFTKLSGETKSKYEIIKIKQAANDKFHHDLNLSITNTCPQSLYLLGKKVYWSSKYVEDYTTLKLVNSISENISNYKRFIDSIGSYQCSYNFGDQKIYANVANNYSGAIYSNYGKYISEKTCPSATYMVCKKNSKSECYFSYDSSKPSNCNNSDTDCYSLPTKNTDHTTEEELEPNIIKYELTYNKIQTGSEFLGDNLTITVEYDNNNDNYISQRISLSSAQEAGIAYVGGVDAYKIGFLNPIIFSEGFPEKVYCGNIKNAQISLAPTAEFIKPSESIVCSPQSNAFNSTAQLSIYSTGDLQISGDNSKNDGEVVATTCSDLPATTKLLKQIYGLIKYLIPVLVIGFSIVDFLKVLLSGEEKVYKESWLKFVKRLVIGVVILILPVILSFIINLSGVLESYGVDKNNIFCIFS